jgi:phosphoglycolate phosphatase
MPRITTACLALVGTTVSAAGQPLPGAAETILALRAAGISVFLVTAGTAGASEALVGALGWRPLVDLVLSPADVRRGLPWPDLPLTALLRLGGGAVSELAVAGDTPGVVESGLRAGAGLIAGVLTGAASRQQLEEADAPHVIDAISGLTGLLGLGPVLRRREPPGELGQDS